MDINWQSDGAICPTCGGVGRKSPRYPGALCILCEELVTNRDGNPAKFYNRDLSGGLMVEICGRAIMHKVEKSPVFVKGIECRAEEARFGGVVIQPVAIWDQMDKK